MYHDVLPEQNAPYFDAAYADVRNAWLYYIEHLNEGRPVVLFGFSQGAYELLQLLAEFGETEALQNRMVAVYAIGVPVTETYLSTNPYVKMAEGETDTGVLISYNAVDAEAEKPDKKEASINPLNWRTDAEPADKTENLGFVAVNSKGQITMEIPQYCGAYIDPDSGKLVVTDMQNRDELLAAGGGIFIQGNYHMYDLTFFYRNLQKNVQTRIEAFMQRGK